MKTETATFGAGCFWGVEAAFRKVTGVVDTAVGYMGGAMERPSYEDVCTDKTGHAEVLEVMYDPNVVRYQTLLETFWHIHDPTREDGQGLDFGTQYRSVIFLSHRRAKTTRRRIARYIGNEQKISSANRNNNRTRTNLLARRVIPPALP